MYMYINMFVYIYIYPSCLHYYDLIFLFQNNFLIILITLNACNLNDPTDFDLFSFVFCFFRFYSKKTYTEWFVQKARLSSLHDHSLTIYLINDIYYFFNSFRLFVTPHSRNTYGGYSSLERTASRYVTRVLHVYKCVWVNSMTAWNTSHHTSYMIPCLE
jgi:hypothetical protein